MTGTTEQQEEKSAQAIWDELEAQDGGTTPAPAAEESTETAAKPVEPGQTATEATAATAEADAGQTTETPNADNAFDKRLEELTHLVKSTAGRVGALQSELTKIGQRASQGVTDAPSQGQIATAAKDPAKWARMKEDFPDWAEAVEAYVATAATPKASDSGAVVELRQQIEELNQRAYEDGKEVVAEFDPQWEEKVRSAGFQAWLAAKPEAERKRIAESVRPSVVLKSIRAWEAHEKTVADAKAKNQSRVKSAAMPTGNSPAPRKNEADMTDEELWAHLDAQEAKAQS